MTHPGQFLLYKAPSGAVNVDVFFQGETVWLTQRTLAELIGVQVPAITKHLKNIFKSGELVEDSVVSILETTAAEIIGTVNPAKRRWKPMLAMTTKTALPGLFKPEEMG